MSRRRTSVREPIGAVGVAPMFAPSNWHRALIRVEKSIGHLYKTAVVPLQSSHADNPSGRSL